MKSTQRNLRGGTLSVLVAACMLLCVLSPAIVNWNEEGFFADSDTFNYVSIGDSMANGFGHAGYYLEDKNDSGKDAGNWGGLLREVETTYPMKLKDHLENEYDLDVDFLSLAASSMRTTELRFFLDPSFEGDYRTQSWAGLDDTEPDSEYKYIVDAIRESGIKNDKDEPYIKPGTGYGLEELAGIRALFKDSIAKADLITYNFHYDFGYAIASDFIMPFVMGGDVVEPDYSVFVTQEYLAFADFVFEIVSQYMSEITEMMPEKLLGFVGGLTKAVAYCVIEYCVNFDKNMELIFNLAEENNKDVNIVVIDSYNTFKNIMMNGPGIEGVPLGDIYGYVMDIVNTYTKYLSPYSGKVYHTTVDCYPTLFSDEFKNFSAEDPLGHDEMNAVMKATFSMLEVEDLVGDIHFNEYYKSYLTSDGYVDEGEYEAGNYTLFLKHVFNNNVLDWVYFFGGDEVDPETGEPLYPVDLGKMGGKYFSLLSLFEPGKLLTEDVVVDEDGNISVGDVSFNKGEVALLWMALFLMHGSAMVSHPSAAGQSEIFDEIINNTEFIGEEVASTARFIADAAVGAPILVGLVKMYPEVIKSTEGFDEFMADVSQIYGAIQNDPLSAFLNLSRESGMEGLNDLIDDSTVLLTNLRAKVSDAPGLIPDGLKEDAQKTCTLIMMSLEGIRAIAMDCSEYIEEDFILNFDPSKPYSEAYVGGVFSMFNDDPKDDADFQKTLFQLVDDKLVESVASKDVIHIATASGNTWYITSGLLPYVMSPDVSDYEPKDYTEMSDILGEDLATKMNMLRDELAASMLDEEGEPTIMNVALDLAMYAYVGSLASTLYMVESALEINPDANILLYGTYNEFRGIDVIIGEETIPVGDILDKLYAIYDIIIYEIAEEYEQVAFVDVSEANTKLFGTEVEDLPGFGTSILIDKDSLVPDKKVFTDGASKWISMENTLCEITWVTYNDAIVDMVYYDTLPVEPEVEEDDAPDGFIFIGWDKEIVKARENTTYTAVYEYQIEDTAVDTVVIDKSAFDYVDVAQVKTDNWSVQIPTAVFDGLEGEVEISVKVVDNKDVPAKIAAYAEGKKIVSLNLSVGGETVSDFGENTVTVTFAYQPDVGEKMDNISVFWIDDANYRTVEYPAYYDADTGEVTFDTTHFSYWFVGERTVADDEDAGNDYLVSIIAFIVIIVGLCGFLLRLKR